MYIRLLLINSTPILNYLPMKKFLIFVLCGTILYVIVSIGLSFLNLSRDWNVVISAVLIGLIQGYIGFLIYGKGKFN